MPESCSTNQSFGCQNQKFRNYGFETIDMASPTDGTETGRSNFGGGEEQKTQEEACRFFDPGNHVVDSAISGNQAKYVNHSCDPNLIAAEKWKLNGMPRKLNYIGFIAIITLNFVDLIFCFHHLLVCHSTKMDFNGKENQPPKSDNQQLFGDQGNVTFNDKEDAKDTNPWIIDSVTWIKEGLDIEIAQKVEDGGSTLELKSSGSEEGVKPPKSDNQQLFGDQGNVTFNDKEDAKDTNPWIIDSVTWIKEGLDIEIAQKVEDGGSTLELKSSGSEEGVKKYFMMNDQISGVTREKEKRQEPVQLIKPRRKHQEAAIKK
ncbi:hypothetical protein B9Z55_025480 [Caenorhabditis nigoni]|uniref:SET domain-containing protein n=1 Tax=Caenorhabditis nigoni TaxID=1611254 RepID=A0A2G5SZC6_9PELO|nr:hypothetical protein B9Z55_025480 [Caenorhabditis nigoni]